MSGWQFAYPYFYTEDGRKIPVFCLNVYKDGPEVLSGGYNVTINNSIQSSQLLNILLNGYPYKTAQQLGVRDDSEAYYITQFAVWINQEGFELWRWINNGEEEYIRNALVSLYNKRDLPTQVINVNINATNTKAMQIDNINPNYISAEYTINSNVSLTNLTVNIPNNQYNAIIRDVNNNVVSDFATLKKFKVLVPLSSLNGVNNVSINMNITAKTNEFNAYYGTAPSDLYQNIGVAILDPVVRNLNATATYNNSTSLDIYVKNMSNQILPNSTVKITNPSNQSIGTYVTNGDGKISLKYIVNGIYKVELLSVPAGYSLDSENIKTIDVPINSNGVINFKARKNSGLIINSIDKQGNVMKDVSFKIINKTTGTTIKETKTNVDGKIIIDNLTEGNYTVIPLETVEGYKIENDIRDITVKYDSDYSQTTYKNYLLGSIEIIKKDINNNYLDNVKFKVTRNNDNKIIGIFSTDISGRIFIANLYTGEYSIQELESKYGYYNDSVVRIVTVNNEDEL